VRKDLLSRRRVNFLVSRARMEISSTIIWTTISTMADERGISVYILRRPTNCPIDSSTFASASLLDITLLAAWVTDLSQDYPHRTRERHIRQVGHRDKLVLLSRAGMAVRSGQRCEIGHQYLLTYQADGVREGGGGRKWCQN